MTNSDDISSFSPSSQEGLKVYNVPVLVIFFSFFVLVLPKFDVTVTAPESLMVLDSEFTVKVCGV